MAPGWRSAGLAVLCFVIAATAPAQAPFRLADTNPSTPLGFGSFPTGFSVVGPNVFFYGYDNVHGYEVWKTDGTAAGTTFTKDIAPGLVNSVSFTPIVASGGLAFFGANDGNSGTELWRSDGTTAGTFRLRDICSGACSSDPNNLIDVNGTLYFAAFDTTNGRELWKTDGTSVGTVLVANIRSGSNSSSPSNLTNVKGALFFAADDGTTGAELWHLVAGVPALFADLDTTAGQGSGPFGLGVSNGSLYFSATVGGATGVYATNGTNPPSLLINNVFLGSFGGALGSVADVGALTVFSGTASGTGTELYVTNGSAGGTHLLADLATGTADGYAFGGGAVLGTTLFFAGNDGTGSKVWKTDGSTLTAFFSANPSGDSFPTNFVVSGSLLYFTASGGPSDLYVTKGIATPTTVSPSSLFASQLTPAFGGVMFTSQIQGEPWFTKGTALTTVQVADVNPDTTSGGGVLFTGNGAGTTAFISQNRIWITNGTVAGTAPVVNDSGTPYSSPTYLVFMNGVWYFEAAGGTPGFELWRTDGTPAGTFIVKDICPGSCSSSPSYLTVVGNTLYFVADDGSNGTELWKSDGTTGGTSIVSNIGPGSTGGLGFTDPLFAAVGSTLFFIADDGTTGKELWKSNGTAGGTALVANLSSGANSTNFSRFAAVNGFLFFGANGRLRRTDGTTTTAALGSPTSAVGNITNLNGLAIFRASDVAAGREVWKSDGTTLGTVLLADIHPGPDGSSDPNSPDDDTFYNTFVNFGGALYFAANDGVHGMELWRTDGVTTSLFLDICPGACSSTPQQFAVVANQLFFQARDNTAGEELWMTDGTFAGTTRLTDIEPGTGASNPFLLTGEQNLVYFQAETLADGYNPYVACAAPTTHYSASAPSGAVSGASFNVSITALDADNHVVPCYTGSVQLTSNDPLAILPSPTAFVAGSGSAIRSVILRTMGTHSITATDTVTGTIIGTVNVTVGASPVTSTITGNPAAITANGSSTSTITVRYKDALGNNITTGGGTLTLNTTRGSLSALINNNDGTYQATLTSGTVSGPAVITGILDGASMTNSGVVNLLAGAPASLAVSVPSSATADAPFTMTVSARDSNGNVADTYAGTVHFTANDTNPTLPANYTFQPSDNGIHTFTNGVVLHTVSNRTITAQDTTTGPINGQGLVAIVGATTTSLQSSANPVVAGTSITLTANVTSTALGGSPAGTVTFKDGGTTLNTVSLVSGSASLTTSSLAAGTHNLTALFNPSNGLFATSASAVLSQFIGSLPAPVIDAAFDAPNNRVVVTFNNTAGAQNIEVLVSTDNQTWTSVGTVPSSSISIADLAPPANKLRLYVAHFLNASNAPGLDSNVDPAATVTFDDDPVGGSITVKLAHITQARAAINLFRTTVGLPPASYTNPTIAANDPVRAIDWMQMRARLDEARNLVPRISSVPAYTDPTLTNTTPIRGAHVLGILLRMK